jgi:Haloacid dehalogenase-like hydrolase
VITRGGHIANKSCLELFTTVEAHSTVISNVPYHNLLSNDEKDYIERKLGRMYIDCWRAKAEEIQAILKEKTWFGFDLDDTLHEFRKASTAAIDATLQVIAQKHSTSMEDLKRAYAEVLAQKTSNAFADGKSSHEYRKERFSTVLTFFSLPSSNDLLEELLHKYELTFTSSLELKCGAPSLLTFLKPLGKSIAVITEGPQDAQERTLQTLGLTIKSTSSPQQISSGYQRPQASSKRR